jgi:hypothetical protein
MKCNETLSKWCKNKHGASKIIDMFEMYHWWWWAASAARSKGTRRWAKAGPEGLRGRGAVGDERARAEVGCRPREGVPNTRLPGVRCLLGPQSMLD